VVISIRYLALTAAILAFGGTFCVSVTASDVTSGGAEQTASAPPDSDSLPPVDPYAAKIVRQSAEFLAALPSVSFSWFVTNDEISDAGETITTVESGKTTEKVRKGKSGHIWTPPLNQALFRAFGA